MEHAVLMKLLLVVRLYMTVVFIVCFILCDDCSVLFSHSFLFRYAWLHPAILFVPFGNKNRFNSGQKSPKGTVVEAGLFKVSRWLYSAYCRVNKWVLNVIE